MGSRSLPLSTKKREKVMPKTKKREITCMACGSNDALYITLKNGERLPSFTMRIGQGIICNSCKESGR